MSEKGIYIAKIYIAKSVCLSAVTADYCNRRECILRFAYSEMVAPT